MKLTIRQLIEELRAASEVVGPDTPVAAVAIGADARREDIELRIEQVTGSRLRCVIRCSAMNSDESDIFFGKGSAGH